MDVDVASVESRHLLRWNAYRIGYVCKIPVLSTHSGLPYSFFPMIPCLAVSTLAVLCRWFHVSQIPPLHVCASNSCLAISKFQPCSFVPRLIPFSQYHISQFQRPRTWGRLELFSNSGLLPVEKVSTSRTLLTADGIDWMRRVDRQEYITSQSVEQFASCVTAACRWACFRLSSRRFSAILTRDVPIKEMTYLLT